MKIYSRKHFVMGLVWLGVAALRLAMLIQDGELADKFWHLFVPVALAGGRFAEAFRAVADQEKQAEKTAQAGRKLYGRGWLVVQNLGYVVITAALVSALLAPNWAGIALLAALAGFFYSAVVEAKIKEEADKLP